MAEILVAKIGKIKVPARTEPSESPKNQRSSPFLFFLHGVDSSLAKKNDQRVAPIVNRATMPAPSFVGVGAGFLRWPPGDKAIDSK